MGYRQENRRIVREEFEKKAREAEAEAERRREEVWEAVPEIRETDAYLSSLGLRILRVAMEGGDIPAAMARLRNENEQLRARRGELLVKNGFPADYDDPRYECGICRDRGYVNGKMCACMRGRLMEAGMKASGLSALLKKQSFGNFSLDYYRKDPESYKTMSENLRNARAFAEHFGEDGNGIPRNLLFVGGTGLGKTHLSTAVARVVIERGYDVFYNSAVGMLSDFEALRFGTGVVQGDGENVARYTECDLLILDDLGTEVVNQFSLSCLYHVLNTRLNLELPTIISTNLSPAEIRKTYSDRIASRLFGEFFILPFRGVDVRQQKI